MNPSYSQCCFKLALPEYLEYDDHIKISYKLFYKEKTDEKIIYLNSSVTDKLGIKESDMDNPRLFNSSITMPQSASIAIYPKNKNIWMKKSKLSMTFLSNKGNKIVTTFSFEDSTISQKGKLVDVSIQVMSTEDEQTYVNCIKADSDHKSLNMTSSGVELINDHAYPSSEDSSMRDIEIPGLSKYLKALRTEKMYLMHEGGRKYKVTNGKLISKVKGIYSYIFDLETELHISDDAPIKIEVSSDHSKGTVLMCEDFQIIVQLESNIGDRIGNAYITVEPWKLLEGLEERLRKRIFLNPNSMASTLIKQGPALASNKPIELIPKGQDAVIKKALSEPVCIVWGPPGTGKTHTMSELAIKFLIDGKKVLIVSHSNVSVDGVAKKIDELLRQKKKITFLENGKVLRYGYVRDEELSQNQYVSSFYYTATKNPVLKKKLDTLLTEYAEIRRTKGLGSNEIVTIRKEINKIRGQLREQEVDYVNQASIVATTISKVIIDKVFEHKLYDVVMFDEVSMAYVLQVVCAATFAKSHFICVGDFMQLAPITQSSAKDVLCEDIFTYLGINHYGKPFFHPWLVMLNEQRRMHPKIAAFASHYVYNDLLKDHSSTSYSRNDIVAAELFRGEAINLLNLSKCYCAASKNADNSRFNILSALISFAVAVKSEANVETVSIITPYAAQTRLVRAMELDYRKHDSTEIRCATVHQFQGSESDVVIFDAVESYPSKKPGWLMGKDFNSILRLINVAVTRARGKLVTVANTTFWNNNYKDTSHTLYRLLSYLNDKGNVIEYSRDSSKLEDLVSQLSLNKFLKFYVNTGDYKKAFETDLLRAHEKIVISMPSGKIDPEYQSTILELIKEKKDQGIQVLIKCNDYASLPADWKKYSWGTNNATFPIIMIDDSITWYGVPLAPWKFIDGNSSYLTVCSIICRIDGDNTSEMIKSLSDLESRESEGGRTNLLPRPEFSANDPEGPGGLAAFIGETKKCPVCKNYLKMIRGKSGKTILWCKECQTTSLLTPDDINHYMYVKHIRCPQHRCELTARVGQYGLYIKCDAGHCLKPEDI
ncbi:AAA domain-containing protein [Oribacterium sp. WCC10]|uniref:AAA domain-containing protein n=1 Tax=Oribacterium sp. WCC10 TaxID=1855343 RepID=UPI0008EDD0AC|nr:AAA domain-containing protein [Oribacterium sp. WCC10]SFG75691.1 AAA domain-containing protein [Oribacterium sp. WCC10]